MDKYHKTFDVYTDVGAGGNHFLHRAKIGQGVSFDDSSEIVHGGRSSVRGTFTPSPSASWGGWYLMNGVLLGNDVSPRANWGTYPNAGYDLRGATKLTFWARGAKGGERVEFFAFGVGRDPDLGYRLPSAPYPDSEAKVTLCGRLVSPCYRTLSTSWTKYTIDLSNLDLHYVIGGFGWVASAAQNDSKVITFYLDDVQYNKPHLNDLHFITSYVTKRSAIDFDSVLVNTSFAYDNALALLAFTKHGDRVRASMIATAFVYAQNHDRYYSDGRLRNAYENGDLIAPPGWTPNGRKGTARPPGWWDFKALTWYEDKESVGSGTGNLAWVMIALLHYYEKYGGNQYLQAAIKLGNWIQSNTRDTRGAGGYTGGFTGWEPTPTKLLWKSTEHNIDLSVAFELLYRKTGSSVWRARAKYAKLFVESMWNNESGYYWTGTNADGITPNKKPVPLDAQTWSLLAFGSNARTLRAIGYVEKHLKASWGNYDGFAFSYDLNTDKLMPWFEGTGQMVVVYRALKRASHAGKYLGELREVQATANNGNGNGIVASPADGLETYFTWKYYNRLHVGATAWFVFVGEMYNPLAV